MTIINRSEKKSSIWGTFILTHAVYYRGQGVEELCLCRLYQFTEFAKLRNQGGC